MKSVVVAIPAFNSESTIAETLESLINQTYKISKLLVLDNASTDNTVNVVKKNSSNFPVEIITREVNIGAEANFTACIQNASGDYFLIAHADDIYEPDFLQESVGRLEKYPEAVAAFTSAKTINSKSELSGERFYPDELAQNEETLLDFNSFFRLILRYSNFITCPGIVIKSEVLKNQIKVWNGKQFNTSADLDVWLRLAEVGPLLSINKPLIRYRVSEASYSFRVAKKRITPHDFFIVLNFYKNKYFSQLTEEELTSISFLEAKDNALVVLNKMRSGLSIKDDFILLNSRLIFWALVQSSWHRSFLYKIMLVKFMSIFYSFYSWIKDDQ